MLQNRQYPAEKSAVSNESYIHKRFFTNLTHFPVACTLFNTNLSTYLVDNLIIEIY